MKIGNYTTTYYCLLCLCLGACSSGDDSSSSKKSSKKLSSSNSSTATSTSTSKTSTTAAKPTAAPVVVADPSPLPNGEDVTLPDVWPNITGGVLGGDLEIRLQVPRGLTASYCLKVIDADKDCYDNSCTPNQNIEEVGVGFNLFNSSDAQNLYASQQPFNTCLVIDSKAHESNAEDAPEVVATTHVYAYAYRPDSPYLDYTTVNTMLMANEVNTLQFKLHDPGSAPVSGNSYELTVDVRNQAMPGVFDQIMLDYDEIDLGTLLWPSASLLKQFFSTSALPGSLLVKNGQSDLALFGYDFQTPVADLSSIQIPQEMNLVFKQKSKSTTSPAEYKSLIKVLVKNVMPSENKFDSASIVKQASFTALYKQKDFCLGGDCHD